MARTPSKAAREQLLRTTAEVLREHGIDAVTIEGVARRAQVAKTTLYRHFGGLEGLVFATAAAGVIDTQGVDTGSLAGDLRTIQRHYLDVASSRINREVFAWMLTRAMHSPNAASLFRSARIQPRGPTVLALQRAIARGEIPATTNIELAMHVIQGPLISKRIVDDTALTDDEFDTLLDMILRALGVRGAADPVVPKGS